MNRKERAAIVQQVLTELYPQPPIPLDHQDAFTLLVAVVLSAQCTDKKVNEITPQLFRAGGTAQAMSKMSAPAILEIIRPLGLAPQKAKALHGLANQLCDRFKGQVPQTFAELESLPGVGHKTASVVMSQMFGHHAFPVDTHIHRLAQRWGLTNGKSVTQTEADLKKLFAPETWRDLHLQIIYFGREHCTARGCDGTGCALCKRLYPDRKKPFTHLKA